MLLKLPQDEMESEMRRLKLELKKTKKMYSEACKEAVIAKEKERLKVSIKKKGSMLICYYSDSRPLMILSRPFILVSFY